MKRESSKNNKPAPLVRSSEVKSKSEAKALEKSKVREERYVPLEGGGAKDSRQKQKSKAANPGPRKEPATGRDKQKIKTKLTDQRMASNSSENYEETKSNKNELGKRVKKTVDVDGLYSQNDLYTELKEKLEEMLKEGSDHHKKTNEFSPQCCACIQCTEAPDLLNTQTKLDPQLEKLFQFVVCKSCCSTVHYQCLALDQSQNRIEPQILAIEVQKEESEKDSSGRVKKKGKTRMMNLMVYTCDDCEQKRNPVAEYRECLACRKPANGHIIRKVKISGDDSGVYYWVHHVCALMLHYVFKIHDLDTFSYNIEPKYALVGKTENEPKYYIIPTNQQRFDKKGAIKHDTQCSFCNKQIGLLLLCGQNFKWYLYRETEKSPQKSNLMNCQKVAHPYCALVAQQGQIKPSYSIVRQTAYENFDADGQLIHEKPDQNHQHLIAKTQQKMQQDMFCRSCYDPFNEKQVQYCFNCVGEYSVEGVDMVWCEKCKNWFHQYCVKEMISLRQLNVYRRKERLLLNADQVRPIVENVPFDQEADFECHLCSDLHEMLTGFPGELLLCRDISKIPNLISFDFSSFTKQVNRSTLIAKSMPSEISLVIYAKLWLKITEILKLHTTSEKLLEAHLAMSNEFAINVSDQAQQLIEFKKKQADQLESQIGNLEIEPWEVEKFDLLDKYDKIIEENNARCAAVIKKVRPFVDGIKQGGHLSTRVENIYSTYLKCKMMAVAYEMLGEAKIKEDQIAETLDKMVKLDIFKTNTFVKLKEINDEAAEWKKKIQGMFNPRQKTEKMLLEELKKIKSRSLNPTKDTQDFFEGIFKSEPGQASWPEIQKALYEGTPKVDMSDFIRQTEQHAEYLQSLIDKPDFPEDRPIKHLKKRLCYLASQPFCPDALKLLALYKPMADWHTQVKVYLGDFQVDDTIVKGLKALRNKVSSFDGDGIAKDRGIMQLLTYKRNYVAKLQQSCQDALMGGPDIDSMKTLIESCNKMGDELRYWVGQVEVKLEIMAKVLSIVGDAQSDDRFEDQLKMVMGEVEFFKGQGIYIPEELETMLEAKVQISEELRVEFYGTLERCADSYSKQLHLDLRRILQKATKDHNLHMETEKRIVENLSKSEEWFVQTFARLKQITGPALHQIDFKDFQQLHGVLTSAKDCDQLLKIQNSKGSDSLVGAAKNLYKSLQSAKWLFEVYSFLDRNQTYVKELGQLLQLYYKAKELSIDLNQLNAKRSHEDEIISDDSVYLSEFQAMAEIAVDFDKLFGTHAKVIATLEEHEDDLQNLALIVDRLNSQLQTLRENKQFPINCSSELESLCKVRTYISLNEDYQRFLTVEDLKPQSSKENQEMEIDEDLFKKPVLGAKISYQKAMKLQRQARESQIPDDIPVLKRLNIQVQKFEKFKRQNGEYIKFRERMRAKGEFLLVSQFQAKDDPGENDSKFTQAFVQRLLQDSQQLQIEIPQDAFDYQQVEDDLKFFNSWKESANTCLRKLEREVIDNREFSEEMFKDLKSQIKNLCCYDSDFFLRIQAFDWVLLCTTLLKGNLPQNNQESQIYNLNFWQNLYNQHQQYLQVLPSLGAHPILQKLQNEISQTNLIIEFVKSCRNTIKSLAGKFILSQRTEQFDNYMAFRLKHPVSKVKKMIDLSQRLKPEIGSEVQEMQSWVKQHQRYTELCNDGTMWQQGIDKVKQILRNMFTSPVDFSEIYFECDKRLKIAEEIRQDFKIVLDETEKRIKLSRIETGIKHFQKNCQITQIPEVEKLLKNVSHSRSTLAKCEDLVANDLQQARTLYLSSIPIDLEVEEIPLRKEIFDMTVTQLKSKITYSQFHQTEKDYLRLKAHIIKVGLQYRNSDFDKMRETVHQDLEQIKQGGDPQNDLVDYTQVKSDYEACQYQKSIKRIQLESQKIENVAQEEDATMNQSIHISGSDVTMSSNELSDQVSNSQDSSDLGEEAAEGGEEEISENNFERGSKSVDGSSSDSSDSSSSDSSEEDVGVAAGRQRREPKPNLMQDHIYFVKPTVKQSKDQNVSKSQLKVRREAKNAAKEFERQRQKTQVQRDQRKRKEELQPLDFSKPFNVAEDSELMSSINKMKLQLRNKSKTQISEVLKLMTAVLGDTEKLEVQKTIKEITLELEEIIAEKHPAVDQNYRKKVADTCENIRCLKQFTDIAELFFTKKILQLSRLTQAASNFKEQVEKMWAQRSEKLKPIVKKPQPARPTTQEVIIPSQQQLLPVLYPGVKRPMQPVSRPMVKSIELDDRKRANSLSSADSLESNPAQFSDDEGRYDPITTLPNTKGSFMYPPPGVMMLHCNYNPGLATQVPQRSQREQILYDPIAHGAVTTIGQQKTKANQAKPGSLLKVFEGSVDIQASQFQIILLTSQDIKIYQKMPDIRKQAALPIKGKSSLNEVCDHFMRIRNELKQQPGSSVLLKGVCQRRSHLSGTESENYQKFFDNMDLSQRSAVFTLMENASLYLIPIGKSTREFCKAMGVLHLTNEHFGNSGAACGFGQEEVCWYAWFCQVRQNFPQRSSGFWNPTVIKHAKDEVVVKEVQSSNPEDNQPKHYSPITSEEPSFESTKKVVEINLIQPAYPVVKAEQNLDASSNDDIDIDQLIARFRQNGEYQNIEQIQATLQPIIHKFYGSGKKEEKLEAFLREFIDKHKQVQVKIEQPPMGGPAQNPIMMHHQQPYYHQQHPRPGYGFAMPQMQQMARPQMHGNMPPSHVFPGIRPPAPMPQQYPSHPAPQQLPQQFGGMGGQMPLPPHMHPHQQMQFRQVPPPGIRPPYPGPYQQQPPPPQPPYSGR